MPRIKIDMDQGGWVFYPARRGGIGPILEGEIEVGEAFLSHYQKIHDEYHQLNETLEHMYRHQEGLKPWPGSPYKEKK